MSIQHKDPEVGNEKDFSEISVESLGAHLIFGDIDTDTMKEASSFIIKANCLHHLTEELTLFINTYGGNCYDGFALIDLMNISRLPIRTVGLGSIVSMGVLIACAGTKGRRVITRNTEIMAHQFTGHSYGKFHELMASNNANQRLQHQFIQHFLRHTTMKEKQIREIICGPTDRWLTPAECKKYGIIDVIVDELPEITIISPQVAVKTSPKAKSRAPK